MMNSIPVVTGPAPVRPRAPKPMPVSDFTLDNDHVHITYVAATKKFFAKDKHDKFNEPALYNTSKRTMPKAATALQAQWSDSFTFRDVHAVLSASGVSYHEWCMMD